MKKIILFTTGIILLMNSCKKTDKQINTNPANDFTIASLKGWFNTQFSKSSEYQLNNGVTLKQPWWKAGRIYDMGSFKVAEMPLLINKRRVYVAENISRSEAERVVASTIYKALFIKTPSGKIEARIAQFTPTYAYLSRKNFNLGNLSFKDYATEFKGTVLLYDFAGHFKKGYYLGDDGRLKNLTVNPPRNNPDGNITNNQPCENLDPNCHYLMHTVYEYACSNGWNVNEGFNPDYCYITQIISQECELLYCDGGPNDNMENCMASGMTSAQCFCALYGIGCESDDAACQQFQAECTAEAAFTVTPESFTMPTSPTLRDTTIKWTVTAQAFNLWKIVANTRFLSNGYLQNNIYKTHIYEVKTTSTAYEGTNILVETTWTEGSKVDAILANDVPKAKTKSTVTGTLKQKIRETTVPFCDWVKTEESVSNSMEMEF
jgi:hypothetical protein